MKKSLEEIGDSDKNRIKRKKAANHHRKGNRRFYSQTDMAIVKRDQAAKNSQIKRGDIEDLPNNDIHHCGCGALGCFIHSGSNNTGSKHINAPVNMFNNDK